jgi:excinuclease UvrABC ATPase subunit
MRLLFSRVGKPYIGQSYRFSFNEISGMCPECEGLGRKLTIDMDQILDKNKSLNEGAILLSGFDVGSWPWKIFAGSGFFDNDKKISDYAKDELDKFLQGSPEKIKIDEFGTMNITYEGLIIKFKKTQIGTKLQSINDMGIGYLTLGQPLDTLSGGECQRLKLAKELHKKGSIYVMDEPSTGLHMSDVENFIGIVESIVDNGNTVIIIEHNMDIIRRADWIIDMGPEGGIKGGEIIFEGTPIELSKCSESLTAKYI